MRTIYLIRHAKSSWETDLSDYERPLNPRGNQDGQKMANLMKEMGVKPDLVIMSSATRAKATAKYFVEALDLSDEIQWESKDLYHASMLEVLDVVASVPDSYKTLMLFGHNPGFTYFANEFWGDEMVDNLPTCGIVKISGDVNSWTMFTGATAQVRAHYFPKLV